MQTALSTKELADLASVSSRTLRYYDQIGLLVPTRRANGYRVYGAVHIRRLQHILLLRACGMPLDSIANALDTEEPNLALLLSDHLAHLRAQRSQLETTIATAEAALAGLEEFETMSDQQKFEQLKRTSVEQFEEIYGQEARQRYGNDAIDEANERMLEMSQEAWDLKEDLETRIKEVLAQAMAQGDVTSPLARQLAEMHAQWIKVHWGSGYTAEAHRNLADGYLADPRFVAYYDDACGEGATQFLRNAIHATIRG